MQNKIDVKQSQRDTETESKWPQSDVTWPENDQRDTNPQKDTQREHTDM